MSAARQEASAPREIAAGRLESAESSLKTVVGSTVTAERLPGTAEAPPAEALSAGSPLAGAASDGSERIPVFASGDVVMRGSMPRNDAFFQIPEGIRAAGGSYVQLHLEFSPALFSPASTVTVQLDDVPLASFTLAEASTDDGDVYVIPLPAGLAGGMFHKLTFVGDLRMPNYACVDPDNEAYWVVIRRDSAIMLRTEQRFGNPNFQLYPSPFFLRGAAAPLQSVFVVPDDAGDAELSGVARLAQFFTSQAGGNQLRYSALYESDAIASPERLAGKHAIWVGGPNGWGTLGSAVARQFKPADDVLAEGWIGVSRGARDADVYDLMIAGSPESIEVAAELLSNETLYGQLNGSFLAIDADRIAAFVSAAEAGKRDDDATREDDALYRTVTFQQMNYNDIVVEQVRQGTTRITFTPPTDMEITGDAVLKLRLRHSDTINLSGSMATVRLNEVPVGSLRFSKQTVNGTMLEIPLKRSVLASRHSQDIDILFQFLPPGRDSDTSEIDCGHGLLGNWAVVEKESSVSYRLGDRNMRLLQSLPHPFIVDGIWQPTTVLLGAEADSDALSETMTLLGRIGSSTGSRSGAQRQLQFVRGLPTDLHSVADRHLIYAGLASQYPEALPLGEDNAMLIRDGRAVWSESGITVDRSLMQYSGVAQIGPSPLQPQRAMLTAVVNEGEPLSLIGRAATSPDEFWKWSGSFILIDAQGAVHNFPSPVAPIADEAADLFVNSPELPPWVFFALLTVVVVLLLYFAWYARQRRFGNRT